MTVVPPLPSTTVPLSSVAAGGGFLHASYPTLVFVVAQNVPGLPADQVPAFSVADGGLSTFLGVTPVTPVTLSVYRS